MGAETLAIAVGDTFLFSPLTISSTAQSNNTIFSSSFSPFFNDSSCITHGIPYYRCFLGQGIEEDYARFVMYASRSSSQ